MIFTSFSELINEIKLVEEECQEQMMLRNKKAKIISELEEDNRKLENEIVRYECKLDKDYNEKKELVEILRIKNEALKNTIKQLNVQYSGSHYSCIKLPYNSLVNLSQTTYPAMPVKTNLVGNSSIYFNNYSIFVYYHNAFKGAFKDTNYESEIDTKILCMYFMAKNLNFYNTTSDELSISLYIQKILNEKPKNNIITIDNKEMICFILGLVEKNLNFLLDWEASIENSVFEKQYLNVIEIIEKVKKRENTLGLIRQRDDKIQILKKRIEDRILRPDKIVNKKAYKRLNFYKQSKFEKDEVNNNLSQDNTIDNLIYYK
jgi:hypothetical protein